MERLLTSSYSSCFRLKPCLIAYRQARSACITSFGLRQPSFDIFSPRSVSGVRDAGERGTSDSHFTPAAAGSKRLRWHSTFSHSRAYSQLRGPDVLKQVGRRYSSGIPTNTNNCILWESSRRINKILFVGNPDE